MGAHRVKTNFNELEKKAASYDNEKKVILSNDANAELKGNAVEKTSIPLSSKLVMRDVEHKQLQAEVILCFFL